MNIKEIQKISGFIERIEKLDKEIVSLEKMCETIVTENTEISLRLSVEKSSVKDKEPVLDSDGSLINRDRPVHNFWTSHLNKLYDMGGSSWDKPKNELVFDENPSNMLSVVLLETILKYKNDERSFLLKQVEKLGVKI